MSKLGRGGEPPYPPRMHPAISPPDLEPLPPDGPTFAASLNLADYFLFDRLAEGLGAVDAVRFGARAFTYAEVAERSERLAAAMQARGLRPEERVLVVLPDTPPFVWSIFATLRAGGVLAMGNPDAPTADLAYLLRYTRAAVLVTLPRVAAALREALTNAEEGGATDLRAVLLVPEVATGEDPERPLRPDEREAAWPPAGPPCAELRAALESAPAFRPVETHRDAPAIWLFTSGSTGKPKAAVHAHRDFAFNTEVYALRTVGYRRGDLTVSVPRLFFGYATGTNLFFPFRVGATTCLFAERPTPESLVAALERHRPTVLTNVPTMIGKLLDHDATRRAAGEPGLDLSSLRFSLSAGEALPEPLLGRWIERFGGPAGGGPAGGGPAGGPAGGGPIYAGEVYDGIGSAEMFHIYATNRPGDVMPGSLGRVVFGYTLRVLPQEATTPGEPALPDGEIGVLWVRGDSVAMGYHQDRDQSFRTFHGRWCRTGDLFRLDARGYLWFGGRADDLLKVSGLWVSPAEVEACLLRHPDVALAAVVGLTREGLTWPKAYVTLRPGAARGGAEDRIRAWARSELAHHKYPREVEVVADLPKNDRGKVDRAALKRALAEPGPANTEHPPRQPSGERPA